jgi:hypothetical protein
MKKRILNDDGSYGEFVEPKKVAVAKVADPAAPAPKVEKTLAEMSVKEMREFADKMGISIKGVKKGDDIRATIAGIMDEPTSPTEPEL